MRWKFFLVLFVTVMIGIQPVFAQGKTVKEEETVINLNLVSDSDFIQALQNASDIELVTEEAVESDNDPN